jgi:hypothetical protein
MLMKRFFSPKKKKSILFRGKDKLFKSETANINCYFEYGVGASTLWILENTNAKIVAVDSDKRWIKNIKSLLSKKNFSRIKFLYCNIGPIKSWGYPENYKKYKNFKFYPNLIWNYKKLKPNVVLIDGRFRVASFLTTLKESRHGTKIIFDDYKSRPQYHVVEKIIKPKKKYFDQALFVVPEKKKMNIKKINNLIKLFEFTLD